MRNPVRVSLLAVAMSLAVGCGGSPSPGTAEHGGGGGDNEFQLHDSHTAGHAHGDRPSEITATATMAAMRLFVVNPDTGPEAGVAIKLTGPDGTAYYALHQTDSQGYAEVLVPVGQRYDLEYLSLGRRSATAHVDVPMGANQDIRLTLRHRPLPPRPPAPAAAPQPEGFVLEGVLFDSRSATIQAASFPRLDRVVEYMTHMPTSRIRVSGHTDNVGDPARNQALSESRAQAVRDYLVQHGIDGGRIEAVGYGDQRPVAPNDTDEGRAQNRRIEAVEL